jgi:hypothetical protein
MHRMMTTAKGMLAFTLAAMAGCAGDGSTNDPGVVDDSLAAMPADGETVFGDNDVVATIDQEGGGKLHFVELGGGGIGVLEQLPAGAPGIERVTELGPGAALADVFHAFSAPGTPMPERLLTEGEPRLLDRPQGWGREVLARAPRITTGACNNTSFSAWFDDYSYNDRGTPDIRLDQVPRTSGYFEEYSYAPGNGLSYEFHRYDVGGNNGSVWYDVDRYVSRVALCNLDVYASETPQLVAHPSISYQGYVNTHMGPVVRMMYRAPGETVWQHATSKDFDPGEVGQTIAWHFYSSVNYDWRTDITWAGADDSFDIGHALEDL